MPPRFIIAIPAIPAVVGVGAVAATFDLVAEQSLVVCGLRENFFNFVERRVTTEMPF